MRAWALAMATLAPLLGCSPSAPSTAAPAVEPAPQPVAPAPPAGAPAVPSPSPPADASDKHLVTEAEYHGWRYYAVYCERCHAPDAVGTADAPDLRFSVSAEGGVTVDSFKVIVRNGSENKEMKGFADLLDDRRIEQVFAYIKARSEGRLAAGRPHQAAGP